MPKHHELLAGADTVHWGYFDATLKPVLSGGEVGWEQDRLASSFGSAVSSASDLITRRPRHRPRSS
jgi:hypothetical protein